MLDNARNGYVQDTVALLVADDQLVDSGNPSAPAATEPRELLPYPSSVAEYEPALSAQKTPGDPILCWHT